MNSAQEVYDTVVKTMGTVSGLDAAQNTCPEAYQGGTTGGCYWSKRDSSELAGELHSKLRAEGLVASGLLRQDYLAWTASLKSKNKRFIVVMIVDSIMDAKPDSKERWKYKSQGYQSKVMMDVIEDKEK